MTARSLELQQRLDDFNSYEIKKNLDFNLRDVQMRNERERLSKKEDALLKWSLALEADELEWKMKLGYVLLVLYVTHD